MKRIILLIAVMLIFITGCQGAQNVSVQASKEEEPVAANTVEVEAEATAPKEQESVKSLDDLYKSYHSLKIQKIGENTVYDVVKPLEFIFADMLSKVHEVDMTVPEGEKQSKGFDYDHYDYRLKFEGAADILFTLEGNVFHFEGEKQLYILWGDSKPLWDNLSFDNKSNSVDIPEEKTNVMVKSYEEDLDGDGKAEDIELCYERVKSEELKGDLTLSINGGKTTVMKDEGWFTKPYHTIGAMPEIWFQQEQNGKSKAVIVIYSWATNGIGSTGVINAYKYVNENIDRIEVKEAKRIMEYDGKDMVSVIFPDIQRTTDVKIDTDSFKSFLGKKDSLKQLFEAKDSFDSHPLWYIVEDYNGDGQAELFCDSIVRWPPIALYSIYTYYIFEKGELKPAQALVTPSVGFLSPSSSEDEKKLYLKESIFNLIQLNGYLTVGEKGIMDESFKPGYDYTPDEIKRTLEELQDDKILKLKGDRMYINY